MKAFNNKNKYKQLKKEKTNKNHEKFRFLK